MIPALLKRLLALEVELYSLSIGRLRVGMEWKPADLWRGGFAAMKGDVLHVWIIRRRTLPIHIQLDLSLGV